MIINFVLNISEVHATSKSHFVCAFLTVTINTPLWSVTIMTTDHPSPFYISCYVFTFINIAVDIDK